MFFDSSRHNKTHQLQIKQHPKSKKFNLNKVCFATASILTAGSLCLFPSLTWAAGQVIVTNANQFILNQQQLSQFRQEQEQKSKDAAAEASVAAPTQATLQPVAADLPCFTINRIYLQGELAHRFDWALSDAIETHDRIAVHNIVRADIKPQCLGAVGVNNLLKRMQNDIIAKGYITTRVLAQPQNLKVGHLVIALIPGRVRHIRYIEDKKIQPTQPWGSQLWNIYPNDTDDLLNLRRVEQALENLKRVPTVDANIQIAPSSDLGSDVASVGDSDLLVAWQQNRPIRLQFSLDDSGTKATGKYQGGVTLSYDNPLHLNDLFYISYNHDLGGGNSDSYGTHSYTGFYSIPLGFSLLSVTTNQYNYHQTVAGSTQNYIYSGDSDNKEIKLSNVLYRDSTSKTTASLGGWLKSSHNFIDNTEIDVQRRRTAGWSLGFSQENHFGASSLAMNLGYRVGTGALESLPAPGQAFGEATSRLKIITADAQLNIPFTIDHQYLHYSFMPRAQWNLTPLDTQEQFSIGGRYTVRGFDGENTLLAERGWTLRNDLGIALGQTQQEMYVGLDGGRVSGHSADQLIGQTLIGSALGLRGGYKGFNYDLFLGHPLSKPSGFKASSITTGFNLNWSY